MLTIPVLHGDPIDKNSIRWYWDLDGYSHSIYNSNGDIIAQIASNVSEYIEIGLNENTTYERKLKSFNSMEESDFSNTAYATTLTNQNISPTLLPFDDKYVNTYNVIDDEIINESLNAFTTGVGDKFDLKVYKQDIEDYNNTFNLISKIYGKYHKNITSFQKVKFNYRVKAVGKYEKDTCEGFVKLKLSATTSDKIKVRVYRYATKDIEIKAKAQCRVSYYEKSGDSWLPKTKTISTNEYSSTLQASVTYTNNGNAVLDVKNNVLVNSNAIGPTLLNIAMSDPVIKASQDNGMQVKLFEYKIYDNYSFNTTDNRYSPSKPRPFELAQYGTVQAHTSSNSVTDIGSGIYMSGYSEGQLFDCEKIFEKSISGDNSEVIILTKDDIDNLIPSCISDRGYKFDGNKTTIKTKIEILEVGPTISILTNNPNGEKVLSVSASTFYETPVLNYSFNDITKNHYISTENIFSNMLKDYNINYNYTLNVIDCTNNIVMGGDIELAPNYIKSWQDDFISGFSLEAKDSTVVLPWEYYYPEYPNEGFNGVVNSINSIDGSCMKKDLIVQLPDVYIPQEMFDVKFKLITENISPENSHLRGEFLNADNDGYTSINGDFAQFSSDATHPIVKEIKDLLKIENVSTITLNDTTTKDFIINIKKPTNISQIEKYTLFELNLEADSNDIEISNYNKDIVFDEYDLIIPFTCKVLRNATSKWHPYIHNGYYYLNQREYYLYSQSNIEGDYVDEYVYDTKSVNYVIDIEMQSGYNFDEIFSYLYSDMQDYNIKDTSLVEFKEGYLYPKPTKESKYYKEYKNIEYVIGDISLPKIPTSYEPITYDLSNDLKQVRLLGRSIDINGDWSEWVNIENGDIPNFPKSHKIQFRLDYIPGVENIKDNITETISDLNGFNDEIDYESSINVITTNGSLECSSDNENAIYYSKVFDFINETSINISTYHTCFNTNESNYLNIHIASSNNEDELKYNPTWVLMDNASHVNGRYIRYRIEFTSNIKVVSIYKNIITTKTITKPQGINNISFCANLLNDELDNKTISVSKISNIICNKKEQIVIDNLIDVVKPVINSYGYNETNIKSINVLLKDEGFSLTLKDNVLDFENEIISEIFSNWNRISHFGNRYPANPSELNYWTFDNNKKEVHYNYNSNSYVGLLSPQSYSKYELKATINSNDYSDKHIGVVLAYEKDSLGKEYTLNLLISPGYDSYKIVYNYMQESEMLILDCKDKVINNKDIMYWSQMDYGIRIEAVRVEDEFIIKRSQENQSNIDDNTLITFNLNIKPQLKIFSKGSSLGFGGYKVRAIFKNLMFIKNDIANSSVSISSNDVDIKHKNGEYLNVENNSISISPFPQQYSPIIVYTDEYSYLRRVFYRNDKNEYSLDIKEEYNKTLNNSYVLTEINIDLNTLTVLINELEISNYDVDGNILTVYDKVNETDIITVKYRVENSFVANYNYHSNAVCIDMHTENEIDKAIVKYETNLVDNRKEAKNICLNPIYNTDTKGFIYLSYDDNYPTSIIIHSNPKSVIANGIDTIFMYFEVVDNIGNPVQNVELSCYCVSGALIVLNNVTDENGVVCATYTSSNIVNVDTITVYNNEYAIKNEININNIEVV